MAFLNIAPTGTVLPFAGSTAPEGWLLCDGSSQSTTTYAKLFAVIAYTYGGTGGSFNVPDMRGVFPRGSGTNGTNNYGGVTGHTPAGGMLAVKGGQKTAKNGLSASSGATTVTGSVGGTDGTHSHNLSSSDLFEFIKWVNPNGDRQLNAGTDVKGGLQPHGLSVLSTNSGHGHGHSLTATPSITTASTDTETTPAFLALNYIIKL